MPADARLVEPHDVRTGLEASFEREITEEDVLHFATSSGDENPLHVDAAYAETTNYRRRIVHGAFQVALASALIGMHLPGRKVLLMSVQTRFPRPLHFPSRVRVHGIVTSWSARSLKGVLKVTIRDVSADAVTAEVFMGFTFHDHADAIATPESVPATAVPTDARIVLVTGSTGGIGREIVAQLAGTYHVVAVTNRQAADDSLRDAPGVTELQLPLQDADWEARCTSWLGGRPVYGIVHAAWPAPPQGGLLDADDAAIEQQLQFAGTTTVRLARFLAATGDGRSGRLVLVGSTYGNVRPNINVAAYSLGKSLLESTARLLAPELARTGVTVNVVNPSVVFAGMNARLNERQRLREAAQIPMGRLCEPGDVASTVAYLLSPGADFISGQSIALTGGQL